MFGFFRRSASRPVSDEIARAIEDSKLTPVIGDPARLRMVQSRGRYSDRQVTYFRIYDPAETARRSLDIQRYRDLDAFQNLVLRSGHVERDGHIVVVRPVAVQAAEAQVRTRAGRPVPTPDSLIPSEHEAETSARTTVVQASTSEDVL